MRNAEVGEFEAGDVVVRVLPRNGRRLGTNRGGQGSAGLVSGVEEAAHKNIFRVDVEMDVVLLGKSGVPEGVEGGTSVFFKLRGRVRLLVASPTAARGREPHCD